MRKTDIMAKATRMFYRTGLKFKKYSPEIFVGAGIVGVVTSTVMACKATTKIDTVLAEQKENIEKTKNYVEENGFSEKYTEKDYKKDLSIFYGRTGLELTKLYGPSVILGTASIAMIIGGHNILRKRNVALAAAYTALDKGFKDYRGRVIERFGKELDKELKYNIKEKEFEEIVKDEETGEEKVVKKTVKVANPLGSEYARFFDEFCVGWTKDPEYNLMFLKDKERYANDLLRTRGHLFLNEVYDMLGIPRTKIGNEVGWLYDECCPNGDNYVDFYLGDVNREATRDFVNGYERSVLLDFNVDGYILDKI